MARAAWVRWTLALLVALYPTVCCCSLNGAVRLVAGLATTGAGDDFGAAPAPCHGGCAGAVEADTAPAPAHDHRDQPCKCGKDRTTLASTGPTQAPDLSPGLLLVVLPRATGDALPERVAARTACTAAAPQPVGTLLYLHCALLV